MSTKEMGAAATETFELYGTTTVGTELRYDFDSIPVRLLETDEERLARLHREIFELEQGLRFAQLLRVRGLELAQEYCIEAWPYEDLMAFQSALRSELERREGNEEND